MECAGLTLISLGTIVTATNGRNREKITGGAKHASSTTSSAEGRPNTHGAFGRNRAMASINASVGRVAATRVLAGLRDQDMVLVQLPVIGSLKLKFFFIYL